MEWCLQSNNFYLHVQFEWNKVRFYFGHKTDDFGTDADVVLLMEKPATCWLLNSGSTETEANIKGLIYFGFSS